MFVAAAAARGRRFNSFASFLLSVICCVVCDNGAGALLTDRQLRDTADAQLPTVPGEIDVFLEQDGSSSSSEKIVNQDQRFRGTSGRKVVSPDGEVASFHLPPNVDFGGRTNMAVLDDLPPEKKTPSGGDEEPPPPPPPVARNTANRPSPPRGNRTLFGFPAGEKVTDADFSVSKALNTSQQQAGVVAEKTTTTTTTSAELGRPEPTQPFEWAAVPMPRNPPAVDESVGARLNLYPTPDGRPTKPPSSTTTTTCGDTGVMRWTPVLDKDRVWAGTAQRAALAAKALGAQRDLTIPAPDDLEQEDVDLSPAPVDRTTAGLGPQQAGHTKKSLSVSSSKTTTTTKSVGVITNPSMPRPLPTDPAWPVYSFNTTIPKWAPPCILAQRKNGAPPCPAVGLSNAVPAKNGALNLSLPLQRIIYTYAYSPEDVRMPAGYRTLCCLRPDLLKCSTLCGCPDRPNGVCRQRWRAVRRGRRRKGADDRKHAARKVEDRREDGSDVLHDESRWWLKNRGSSAMERSLERIQQQ